MSVKPQKVSVEVNKPTPPASERPLTRFDVMERDFERLFDQLMPRGWHLPFRAEWPARSAAGEVLTPRVDVIERDDEIVVRAELPGVEKKDLDVSLTDRSATIKASARRESSDERGDYHRREISTGYLSRVIALPAGVNASACKAEFKDGLLELKIPKQAKANRIQVEVK